MVRFDGTDKKIDNVYHVLDRKIDALATATKQGFDDVQRELHVVKSDVQILKRHAALTDARVERLETVT